MNVQGITVLLINPQGRVAAHASDFDGGMSAGISRREAQTYRAKAACAADFMHAACNQYVAKAICSGYPGAEGVVRALVNDHGFKIEILAHRYDGKDGATAE